MNQVNRVEAVVVDASVIVSIVAKENTHAAAEDVLTGYLKIGAGLFAPNVVVAEVIYALCQKLASGSVTEIQHQEAILAFRDLLDGMTLADNEAGLLERVVELRDSYGCSRSSDGLYIALAERLGFDLAVEIFTLDGGIAKQASKNAPTVTVRTL